MSEHGLVFNGIDARTGGYLISPCEAAQVARVARGLRPRPVELDELHGKLGQDFDFPVKEGVDADDLAQSGWAVVFPFARRGSPDGRRQEAVREALRPLLARRRAQALGRGDERLYRECVGPAAYRAGESKRDFLERMLVGPGPVAPEVFPYYVLLVGGPDEIPYSVQYQLDVQYAVGRLDFEQVDDFARYAEAVVAAEEQPPPRARTAAFFGVEHAGDRATESSRQHLVAPLADFVERRGRALAEAGGAAWQVRRVLGEDASKAALCELLATPPALLFSASHGIAFPCGDPLQRERQGAFLCQDWEGPRAGALRDAHYFCGDDLGADSDLGGLLGFHFACYGAGTPARDEFARPGPKGAPALAPQPFVARLPQRMLARGALAVIGHVDRAWGGSFVQADPRNSRAQVAQRTVFESMLQRLLSGSRVGYAMDYFDLRYAETASDLAARIDDLERYEVPCSDEELAALWLQANDARNFAVLGDPAVRIAGARADEGAGEGAGAGAGAGADVAAELRAESAPERSPEEAPPESNTAPDERAALIQVVIRHVRERAATGWSVEVETEAAGRSSAYTRCTADGRVRSRVPVNDTGAIDEILWRIHSLEVARIQDRDSAWIDFVRALFSNDP